MPNVCRALRRPERDVSLRWADGVRSNRGHNGCWLALADFLLALVNGPPRRHIRQPSTLVNCLTGGLIIRPITRPATVGKPFRRAIRRISARLVASSFHFVVFVRPFSPRYPPNWWLSTLLIRNEKNASRWRAILEAMKAVRQLRADVL